MLRANPKKSIRIKNRTNYFNPATVRTHVHISSPHSYQSRQIKIEGYETRLYWQFRYCEDHNGQTFFYTLTYNDKSIPRHYGINCFDYEDLRDLFTGGFRKQLLRKFGTTFKYFVGAELGDGKGSRGMHNNPHYHVLFFLESANNPKFPYKKISPVEFRHLVRLYWQGFDESVDGYRDYNLAKYGIAREGENTGLVSDFRACMYCAKYVCKDVKLKQNEDIVRSRAQFKYYREYKEKDETYADFFHTVLFDMYNTPTNPSKTEWCFNDLEFIEMMLPGTFSVQYSLFPKDWQERTIILLRPYVEYILNRYHLWNDFTKYVNQVIEPLVKEEVNEWRNRFCNKCRISQGVGDYALQHIADKLNPSIQVPSKKGFKNRPIGMYYYRKLYTDVVRDSRGSNLYVLNELGQQYKLAHLSQQTSKMSYQAQNNLNLIIENPELFEKMKNSDINISVNFSHSYLKKKLDYFLKDFNIKDICRRYAEYKLVYEDRFFELKSSGDSDAFDFPRIDPSGDYARFLVPSFYSVSRNDLMLDMFLEDTPENYLPYSEHPYFLRFISLFAVLDMCSDYWFIQKDDKAQKDAEDIAATKRFHSQQQLKDFYSQFK